MQKRLKRECTPFQLKVYETIKKIPKGEVRSYMWVAARIGQPKAYRAVGNALNKNPCPIVVPCHRVVKSDGSVGGFSRGLKEKLRLLRCEGLTAARIRDIIKAKNVKRKA